ncbi:hypothetical protein [Rhabdochlamydiaceae symbiont of Dictyostelium giganteum]|uniref:hypothetical protein n=1 Tax=Rhabdochlamydiaceae symbiont of Dictyostelium giganteum TaxID=3342349 RepID=UPI00384AA3FC
MKLTKLMAYVYAYQKSQDNRFLIQIGDALHPEQRITLNNKLYEKRSCYREGEADLNKDERSLLIKEAESLYPHEHVRKEEILGSALEENFFSSTDHWKAHITLAQILSQQELKESWVKYLLISEECLESYKNLEGEKFENSIIEYYDSLNSSYKYEDLQDIKLDDNLYFAKKQKFLLGLLTYLPSCEEAYVALARSFQAPLMIQEKSYASKESLYLKAIDINPEYSLPYFLLGKELFLKGDKNTQLLNGITLPCKQLLMRAIQLGTYQEEAYHLAALIMEDRDGILLFDGETVLSRGDLFIRAFELDSTRVIDLKKFYLFHE